MTIDDFYWSKKYEKLLSDYKTRLKAEKVTLIDKIRTEIEQEKVGYPPSAGYYKAIMKVLQIIDKYKAETE